MWLRQQGRQQGQRARMAGRRLSSKLGHLPRAPSRSASPLALPCTLHRSVNDPTRPP